MEARNSLLPCFSRPKAQVDSGVLSLTLFLFSILSLLKILPLSIILLFHFFFFSIVILLSLDCDFLSSETSSSAFLTESCRTFPELAEYLRFFSCTKIVRSFFMETTGRFSDFWAAYNDKTINFVFSAAVLSAAAPAPKIVDFRRHLKP